MEQLSFEEKVKIKTITPLIKIRICRSWEMIFKNSRGPLYDDVIDREDSYYGSRRTKT